MRYPKAIQNLIEQLAKLPSVGPKTAERYVFWLLKQNAEDLQKLAQYIAELREKTVKCRICLAIAESNPCPICADPRRQSGLICVVENTHDLMALESAGVYAGVYHVLGGAISAASGINPEQLAVKELLARLAGGRYREIILALNPNMDGETTALYLAKLLKPKKIKITRLAKGLPMGADLEYADQITLSNALKYRNPI